VNILHLRRLARDFGVGTLTALLFGCIVPGGEYYDGDTGAGYYEPAGVIYGGWGPGYHVGPYRGGDHHPERGGGHGHAPAYRPAPASRPIPSIPTRSRSGGSRSR